MDYGKSGAPKQGSNKPRYGQSEAKGAPKGLKANSDKKAELLKRMQAAAARNASRKIE
ncbi:hypothetical protein KMP13_15875 [Epibacterium ulvae]|uniref:hypothetical protein n=1 Tax=Epibacterium ulvae TaxID=1156985 RepID=UPI001BFCC6B0|nr:hypothetical protein [Epibacterium ulvae]MBT8155320.1 hypothetical protein [Epibacterium ulvae]